LSASVSPIPAAIMQNIYLRFVESLYLGNDKFGKICIIFIHSCCKRYK
jgi:hypothetical protein